MTEEIIDLLDNPEFKLWVWFPNEALDRYWNSVLLETPERIESIQKARSILEALTKEFEVDFPGADTVDKMLGNIFSSQ